jgi:hypothetical protein
MQYATGLVLFMSFTTGRMSTNRRTWHTSQRRPYHHIRFSHGRQPSQLHHEQLHQRHKILAHHPQHSVKHRPPCSRHRDRAARSHGLRPFQVLQTPATTNCSRPPVVHTKSPQQNPPTQQWPRASPPRSVGQTQSLSQASNKRHGPRSGPPWALSQNIQGHPSPSHSKIRASTPPNFERHDSIGGTLEYLLMVQPFAPSDHTTNLPRLPYITQHSVDSAISQSTSLPHIRRM